MMTIEQVDMTGFTNGLEGLIEELGIAAPKVIKTEVGALIKTLVKITPPTDLKKSRDAIDKKVNTRFEAASTTGGLMSREGHGGGLIYYRITPQSLFAAGSEKDMTSASTDQLKKTFYTLTSKGKQKLPWSRYKNRRQTLILSQNIVVKKSQITSLKTVLKRKFGRLKAAWCTAIFAGKIEISGGLPKMVTRHSQGARGRFNDGTGDKDMPYFEIANSALGVEKTRYFLQQALDIRGKAMEKNTQLFFEGRKHLSDYARRN